MKKLILAAMLLTGLNATASEETICFVSETGIEGRYNYVEVKYRLLKEKGDGIIPGSNPEEISCNSIDFDSKMDADTGLRYKTTSNDPRN